MPTFFDYVKRLFSGQPVFKTTDNPGRYPVERPGQPTPQPTPDQQPQQQQPQAPTGPVINKADRNTFPVVRIEKLHTHEHGDSIEVYAEFRNEWPEEIMLDKIFIFNTKHEIDNFLRGHQEREFLVYRGKRLTQQFFQAELIFKTAKDNDYFKAVHDITYMYHESDRTYTPNAIRLHLPIRDIYE